MDKQSDSFGLAIASFDAYNGADPNKVQAGGIPIAKELLYAQRMSEKLSQFRPDAGEVVQLAIRCQHIGRWEIPRSTYPEGKKGYLQWRNALKFHHAAIAAGILKDCGYPQETIDQVEFLVLKKQLQQDAGTKLLEDVVCLVFLEFYLEDFTRKHEAEKVVDILQKTLKKMTPEAVEAAGRIPYSSLTSDLVKRALGSS